MTASVALLLAAGGVAAAATPAARPSTTTLAVTAAPSSTRPPPGLHEQRAEARYARAVLWVTVKANHERQAREAAAPRRRPSRPPRASRGGNARSGDCGGWRELVVKHFGEESAGHACSVLMCESGGNPGAVGPVQRDGSARPVGLMQVKGGSTDPEANIAQAAAMHEDRGWQPWACR